MSEQVNPNDPLDLSRDSISRRRNRGIRVALAADTTHKSNLALCRGAGKRRGMCLLVLSLPPRDLFKTQTALHPNASVGSPDNISPVGHFTRSAAGLTQPLIRYLSRPTCRSVRSPQPPDIHSDVGSTYCRLRRRQILRSDYKKPKSRLKVDAASPNRFCGYASSTTNTDWKPMLSPTLVVHRGPK